MKRAGAQGVVGGRGLDREALTSLFDECAGDVLRFFARRSLDPESAADLVAETFAAAIESRGRFDPSRGAPRAWLFGIARHLLSRYVRTRKVEEAARRRLGFQRVVLSADDFDRIEALIDMEALGRVVRAELSVLPGGQREPLLLRVVDELSYAEIADRLGCSEPAARIRVSRGLRELGVRVAARNPIELGGGQ